MRIFSYNFGFDGDLDEPGKEKEVKSTIRGYFDSRDDTELIKFTGNPDNVAADIMTCRVRVFEEDRVDGYNIIDDLVGSDGTNLDNDVYIIQGGPE
ncbi:hypothetical protein [Haloarcula sp. H-GB5]|jgi:hypothetical protein